MGGLVALTIFIYVVIGFFLIKTGKEMGLSSIPLFLSMGGVICFELGAFIAGIVFLVLALIALIIVLIIRHKEKAKYNDKNAIYIYKAKFSKKDDKYIFSYSGRKSALDGITYEGSFNKKDFQRWVLVFSIGYSQTANSASGVRMLTLRRIASRDYKNRMVFDHETYEGGNLIQGIYLTTLDNKFVLPLIVCNDSTPDNPESFLQDLVDKIKKLCE